MSQLFASGGQSIGALGSASVLPMNSQDWFPLELTGFISLQSKGLSRDFSNTTVQKHQFFRAYPVQYSGLENSMDCSTTGFPFFTIFQSLLKLMSVESVMPPNHFILCHPLLLLPSIFPSIRVFSNESAVPIKLLKYWSFSFSISPFNEYSGLISFRIDWFDLLAVQGTLKSLDYWIRYSTWRNSVLFLVWDDAGGWVHWNQSFHTHLCYPGPVSCVFTSWASFPQGSL